MHARRFCICILVNLVVASRCRHVNFLEHVDVAQGRVVQRPQLRASVDDPCDVEPWEVAGAGGEGADEAGREIITAVGVSEAAVWGPE